MEITKKIVIVLTSMFLLSCKNDNFKLVKDDLFEKDKTYFIQQKAVDFENKKDTIVNYCDTIIYNGKDKKLTDIIDINSFKKEKKYYSDKNNVYISSSTPLYFPTINGIKCINKSVHFLGADYYNIDNKIYFQSLEVKNANPKSFIVTDSTSNGYYYAKDDKNLFYKEKQIQKK